MSDREYTAGAKKPYSKPSLTRQSTSAVAALLREGFSTPVPNDTPREPLGPMRGPVLLVEGYSGGLGQVSRALKDAGLAPQSHFFENGDEFLVIGFAREEAPSAEPSQLLLLDLRFTGQTNRELFETITKHPKLQRTPVAFLLGALGSEEQVRVWTGRDPMHCWRLQGLPDSEDLARAFKSFLEIWRCSHDLVLSDTR